MGKVQNKNDVDAIALKRKLSKQFTKKYFRKDGSFDHEKFKRNEYKMNRKELIYRLSIAQNEVNDDEISSLLSFVKKRDIEYLENAEIKQVRERISQIISRHDEMNYIPILRNLENELSILAKEIIE